MRNETIAPSPFSRATYPARLFGRAVDGLIFWSVAIVFAPWILRERLRRRRQGRAHGDPAVERALRDLSTSVQRLNETDPGRPLTLVID